MQCNGIPSYLTQTLPLNSFRPSHASITSMPPQQPSVPRLTAYPSNHPPLPSFPLSYLSAPNPDLNPDILQPATAPAPAPAAATSQALSQALRQVRTLVSTYSKVGPSAPGWTRSRPPVQYSLQSTLSNYDRREEASQQSTVNGLTSSALANECLLACDGLISSVGTLLLLVFLLSRTTFNVSENVICGLSALYTPYNISSYSSYLLCLE